MKYKLIILLYITVILLATDNTTQKQEIKKQIKQQTVPYHEYLMNKLDVEDFSLENKLKDHNRVMKQLKQNEHDSVMKNNLTSIRNTTGYISIKSLIAKGGEIGTSQYNNNNRELNE